MNEMINLEQYLIDDIAEESTGDILKNVGIGIATLVTLPFIAFGSIKVVNGINIAMQSRKLYKAIKNNQGNASSYGKYGINILDYYKNDITGVIEPKGFKSIYAAYNNVSKIQTTATNLAKQLSNLDPNSTQYDQQSETLAKKFNTLSTLINDFSFPDSSTMQIDSEKTIGVDQSMIYKISTITNSVYKNLDVEYYKDGISIAADGNGDYSKNKVNKTALSNNNLRTAVDEYISAILEFIPKMISNTNSLIEKCKFAVNPNVEKKKLSR